MTDRALLIASFALVAGCGEASDTVDPALYEANPTYSRDIAPLFDSYCIKCHARSGRLEGGVELDVYESAFSGRVRNACVSVRKVHVERFAASLMPVERDPPVPQQPCGDWEAYSMPTGVTPHLTEAEQVILLRWVETGAPQ